MAINLTVVRPGARTVIIDVESDADADVAAVIPHGLGFPVEDIQLSPLMAEYYLSAPTIGVVDAVNINLVLVNAVGSGVAGDQIRVIISRPHSLIEYHPPPAEPSQGHSGA